MSRPEWTGSYKLRCLYLEMILVHVVKHKWRDNLVTWYKFTGAVFRIRHSKGAYHLTEKSGWGVESIMVSDLPLYRRNAISVTVWIQKKGKFVSRESGTEKELRNWLMVSNIPFGSYQPEWTDYLKTYSSIFGWNFRKATLPFTFHPEFPKFSGKW